MTDLGAFLTARLDEEEANARQALAQWPDTHFTIAPGSLVIVQFHRRHDPARVIREVEAKRQMVRRAIEARTMAEGDRQAQAVHGPDWGPCRPFSEQRERTYWEYVLPYLGLIYAGHPDYDPAWRP